MSADAPPDQLVRSLIGGPSIVTGVEWFWKITSTNARLKELAAAGAPEGRLVVADVQTQGRGRHGRSWHAPAGSSLMWSILLRPTVPADRMGLLPLVTGLAVAEAIGPSVPTAEVGVKWPNDVLVAARGTEPRKVAGILVESVGDGACAVGIGLNTDWRGIARPDAVGQRVTSLSEAAGTRVDRWRVLAGLVGVLGNRYDAWQTWPAGFLADYRERSLTLGRRVRVTPAGGTALRGRATGIAGDGALEFTDDGGRAHVLHAGDVEHLRPL